MTIKKTTVRELTTRIIPVGIVMFLVLASLASLSSLTAPNDPVVSWIDSGQAYLNQMYRISFMSDVACDWSVNGVGWLAAETPTNETDTLIASGKAGELGKFEVNVTATRHEDRARITWLNVPIDVIETDDWGYVETFNGVGTGAHGNATFNNVAMDNSLNTETVVLDGFVWIMTRGDDNDSDELVYKAPLPSSLKGWNLSYEAYPPKENSAINSESPIGKFGIRSYLMDDNGSKLAGVEMAFGSPNESISIFNASDESWDNISNEVLPSFLNESEYEGCRPDRYIISYEGTREGECLVTIWHTIAGKIFSGKSFFDAALPIAPRLGIYTDAIITGVTTGAWILDNIAFRSASVEYPIVEPDFEYIYEDEPAWIVVKDVCGKALKDARVMIDGRYAVFNSSSDRYESILPRRPDWSVAVNYSVTVNGMKIEDSMKITLMSQKIESVMIERWWNGWDWATVLGLDDAQSASTAIAVFHQYQHPATGYLMATSGDSGNLLATQSEIGLHMPHEVASMPIKFWNESVAAAADGHSQLENHFTFASRWDDPAYVGRGDMYISMANPGSSASFQMLFAEYARGTRIDGASSNPVPTSKSAGNASLIGSWWIPQPGQWSVEEGGCWAPRDRMDLMDAVRAIRTEGDSKEFGQWPRFFYIAERHGLLRMYTHNNDLASGSKAEFLTWIDDEKTNYSLENWKATDGEAASYVYGRWSTDVHLNEQESDGSRTVLKISRQNPIEAGYWRVPVTISIDISGKNPIEEIVIEEGERILKASDGSLKDLGGKRIMDVGYDVRGDKVYISYFWNSSSILSVSFKNERADSEVLPSDQLGAPSVSAGSDSIRASSGRDLPLQMGLRFDPICTSQPALEARNGFFGNMLLSVDNRLRNYPLTQY